MFRAVKAGFFLIFLSLAACSQAALGAVQGVPEPKRDQLLNRLNVLVWQRAGDPDVLLKLRIHSGAAFDLAGRAGTMALLGDALFPDQTTRDYFTEELGGRVEVTTDHDAINITLTGHAREFERIVDLLRAAIVNPVLTADAVSKLREARLKLVSEASIAPGAMADRAIAARLYGDFPYGRPAAGTPETLSHVERADLLFARDRFLSPNNSTLVVIGGVDERRAMRALRQLLGMWRKSDRIVPATFRQPDAPDARTLILDLPGAETAEIRLAARTVARSDRDYAAATVLALLARDRWQAALPELNKSAFFVRQEARVLPGMFVMGASVSPGAAARALASARSVLRALATSPPVATADFERARSEAVAVLNKQTEEPETLATLWLDAETYKLAPVSDQLRALNQLTPSDVQRVAAKLFRDAPLAAVAVASAAELAADLGRDGKIEVTSAAAQQQQPQPPAAPVPTPAKTPL
ncbi:MAG TPA: insulinase family protein [Pyrinomonadaceae bacterium]|jgi:predicted Zn-dependent peptidase|nr:insulinase family protein [Pyrinomonadaceae bacterium]